MILTTCVRPLGLKPTDRAGGLQPGNLPSTCPHPVQASPPGASSPCGSVPAEPRGGPIAGPAGACPPPNPDATGLGHGPRSPLRRSRLDTTEPRARPAARSRSGHRSPGAPGRSRSDPRRAARGSGSPEGAAPDDGPGDVGRVAPQGPPGPPGNSGDATRTGYRGEYPVVPGSQRDASDTRVERSQKVALRTPRTPDPDGSVPISGGDAGPGWPARSVRRRPGPAGRRRPRPRRGRSRRRPRSPRRRRGRPRSGPPRRRCGCRR